MPTHSGLLPREGLTSEPIFRFIAKTALNPALTLPLVLLARYTKKGERLRILYPKTARRLKVLFYWGLVRWLSSWYSRKVLNNWVVDKSWGRDWSREVAVVTGGAGGIGGYMVKLLVEKGIKVVVLDIQDMTFEGGPNVHHFKCDITSPAQISSAASQVRAKLGDPTILINNAGVARGKTILDASERDVRFTFDVNTLSHYWLAKEFVPAMVKRNHGMIVTIASFAAYITVPNMVDYAASKAAAVAFHEGLAAELVTRYSAPRVRTVLVNQGYTKTALFTGYNNSLPFLSPTLEPETVADAVVKKIFEGNSGQVIVPSFGAMLTALRSLPHWYQTRARVRGQDIMKKWEGRQVVEDLEKFYEAKEKSEESESTILVEGKGEE